jgi:type IV secretory pathway TrbL component
MILQPDYYFATLLLFCTFALLKAKLNWDAIGVTASLACAIHCAILPLFLSSLPLFGINIIHNLFFEAGMVLLAFGIGSYSFYHGYRRHHHTLLPFILFAIGIALLVVKLFFIQYEKWLLVPAVTLIIVAHIINFRSCRVHNHAHADDCAH